MNSKKFLQSQFTNLSVAISTLQKFHFYPYVLDFMPHPP